MIMGYTETAKGDGPATEKTGAPIRSLREERANKPIDHKMRSVKIDA